MESPGRRHLSRRRFLTLCAGAAGLAAAGTLAGWRVEEAGEHGKPGEGAEAAMARLNPRVAAAVRQQSWYQNIDAPHVNLLEWLVAGHYNAGGVSIAAPAVGSTFKNPNLPISPLGALDTDRQLAVIEQNLFMFLGDRPVIFSSDTPLSSSAADSAKRLVATWFPQVEAAIGKRYPYAGTHIQLNVADVSGRATTRGANIWLSPDFSNLAHAFVHERTHSFQYGADQLVRFPIFASEGSAESMATLLTATPALWHGDNTAIDANLTAASPGAGAAYGEQSFNGYQLFADLQQVLGHGAFMSAMQALHAGAEPRSGVEVLSLFRNSTSNPAAVDALYQRSVQNYAEVSAAVRA